MRRILSMALLGLLLCPAVLAQNEAAKREAAEQAARSWLALVDRGEYGHSWQEAAAFFQSKVSKEDWEKALEQVRTPLGTAGDRTLLGSMLQSELPNAPKGDYVVIQFKTLFAGKGHFIETVTPMLEKDGTWRVSGYFVKPAE